MNILMICVTFPYPPSRGGTQVRTFNLLQSLAKNHSITLLTQQTDDVTEEEIIALKGYVTDLKLFPRPSQVSTGLVSKLSRFARFILTGTPPNVFSLYSPELQNWLDEAVLSGHYQVITAEHSVNAIYIRPTWRQKLRTVINIHSSPYRTCQSQLLTGTSEYPWRDRLYLPLLYRYECSLLALFSTVVVTTDEDAIQMKHFSPDTSVVVIPNGVDLNLFPYRQADLGGYHLVFVGGLDYFANIDAVCFFTKQVLPLLQSKYPQTTLSLVGSNPSAEVLKLAQCPGVTVTGRVPYIVEYLHQATVSIVPLRTGFGIKNKTLESMAAGVPVVSSDRGLEGLSVENPLIALRANTVSEYVECISRLFDDSNLRSELSKRGRSLIEQDFQWDNLGSLYAEKIISS